MTTNDQLLPTLLPRPVAEHSPSSGQPWARTRRLVTGLAVAATVTAVCVWMLLWLIVSFIGFPLGADGLCATTPTLRACGDAFLTGWLVLMAAEIAATIATLVLWLAPRRLAWGLAVGLLGTGGAAIVFSLVFELALV